MNGPPTTDTHRTDSPRSHRLRLRAAKFIVLGLCAIAIPVWQQCRQIWQLQEFADRSGYGKVDIDYHHPEWMNFIVSSKTYVPLFDELKGYSVPYSPLPAKLLSVLTRRDTLQAVNIDVSECSPQAISELKRLNQLRSLELHGNHEPIPLEWTRELPELKLLIVHEVPVSADEWSMLISLPNMNNLSLKNSYTYVSGFTEGLFLNLTKKRLTSSDAENIATIQGLNYLQLTYMEAEPRFWESLGKLSNLQTLSLFKIASEGFELSQTELKALEEIPSLKTLQLLEHSDLNETENVSEAWQRFRTQRPDISIHLDHFSPRPPDRLAMP